jgi:hypothetical protein
MTLTLSALQKQRRDTAANWTAENPTLLAGEIGIESDTGKIKIGNGSTAWASLGYQGIIPSSGAYPLSQLLMPSGTASVPSISFDGDTNLGVYRSGADQLGFATAGTERMRLDSSGGLGLGTSSPSWPLDVRGSAVFFAEDAILGLDAQSSPRLGFVKKAGASPILAVGSGTAFQISHSSGTEINPVSTNTYTPRLTISTAGNVGIGTTSPAQLFHIAGVDARLRIQDTDNTSTTSTAFLEFSGSDTRAAVIYTNSNGLNLQTDPASGQNLLFFTAGANERARIDSSGRLLVGTSSDSGGALLQVNGNRVRIATAKTPASASDTGTAGEICWDANYIYVCTATNTWKRTAISTW